MQSHVLLGGVQLEEELVEPRVDVPVDVPEVVAWPVVPEVGELEPAPAARAGVLSAQQAAEDLPRQQLELLQLAQERLVEDGGRYRGRSRRAGVIAIAAAAQARGSPGTEGVSRTTSAIRSSTSIPSASPSKLSRIRCRSAGGAAGGEVFEAHVDAPGEEGESFRGEHNGEQPAGARAVAHVAADHGRRLQHFPGGWRAPGVWRRP